MNFIQELEIKGYLHQITNRQHLESLLNNKQQITAYLGFDCTARSLHIGSLIQIMILRLLQKHGHKPIIILGGGTTKIGDPSGKDQSRQLISNEEIQENVNSIHKLLKKFLVFGSGKSDALLLNNQEWLNNINYLDFLREYGKLFSVNKMLTMDSVKLRLDRKQSLTFLEFNYMLLQAYDFYYLSKYYNCNLQIGGSDQWGNIITGIDLVKRTLQKEVLGLTTPLITTSTGEKMGKTTSGAVWLDQDMCSPYNFFQYWRNITDRDVIKFAKLFGEFNQDELEQLTQISNQNINEAKKLLAHKITIICHGKQNADAALQTTIQIFENKNLQSYDNLPQVTLSKSLIDNGLKLFELLVLTKLVESNSAGKRLIRNNGVKVNDYKITEENSDVKVLKSSNMILKLSIGKKIHLLVKFI